MRKLLIIGIASMFVTASAMGATIREQCGCGLGSLALGDQESTMLLSAVATFLNGISGNQTFGISSGTLGCEPAAGFVMRNEVEKFVSSNMDHLAMDMAQGRGDTLDALADLMQIEGNDRLNLFAELQINFESIFPAHDATVTHVVDGIEAVLGS